MQAGSGLDDPVRPGQGSNLMKGKQGGNASEFLVYMENSLNYALEAARPPTYTGGPWGGLGKQLVGWHGKLNQHAAAFLDGHATYMRFDTRANSGKGWTIWPSKPWGNGWETYNDRVLP